MLKNGSNVGLGSDYGSLDAMSAMKLMLIVHNIDVYKRQAPSDPPTDTSY